MRLHLFGQIAGDSVIHDLRQHSLFATRREKVKQAFAGPEQSAGAGAGN